MAHKRARRNRTRRKERAFFAYPSQDKAQAEIIEGAIREVNMDARCKLYIHGWRNPDKESSKVIANILAEIDKSDQLLADISGTNPNVLFELGYAFGRRKKLLLFIQGNSTRSREDDLKRIELLSGLEFHTVQNTNEVIQAIREHGVRCGAYKPDIDMYGTVLGQPASSGLFLMGFTKHEIAVGALRTFERLFPRPIVDDWTEDRSQHLSWYVKAVDSVRVVTAVLVCPAWDYAQEVNARFSFVCGLALALGKGLLMLGLPGYEPAFDYREYFKKVDSSDAATRAIEKALSKSTARREPAPAQPSPTAKVREDRPKGAPSSSDKELILLDVVIGDIGSTVAEMEETDLADYFVRTSQFLEALKGKQTVFVGSKGSGKTANFYQLRHELAANVENVVCDIKPSDYRMSRFLEALRRVSSVYGAAAHVTETAWKLVIYLELVNVVYEGLRPEYAGRSPDERDLVQFWETHRKLVTSSFESKLETTVTWLEEAGYSADNFSRRVHDQFISAARRVLAPLLSSAKKTVILIDNLDKTWDREQDLDLQANVVFALMGVGRRIESDFNDVADVRLVMFLRRNILEYIVLRQGRERDKLLTQLTELTWSDAETLFRVIDRRVQVACERNGLAAVSWPSLFVPEIGGEPTQEWIFANIFPRPRDLIHFMRGAMELAYNRSHGEVQASDLHDAFEDYSGWAVNQAIAEYQAESSWMSSVIPSFIGLPVTFKLRELERRLGPVGRRATPPVTAREMVARLVQVGFLGLRLTDENVMYATTMAKALSLQEKVRSHPNSDPLELVVHPVFRPHLGSAAGSANLARQALGVILRRN